MGVGGMVGAALIIDFLIGSGEDVRSGVCVENERTEEDAKELPHNAALLLVPTAPGMAPDVCIVRCRRWGDVGVGDVWVWVERRLEWWGIDRTAASTDLVNCCCRCWCCSSGCWFTVKASALSISSSSASTTAASDSGRRAMIYTAAGGCWGGCFDRFVGARDDRQQSNDEGRRRGCCLRLCECVGLGGFCDRSIELLDLAFGVHIVVGYESCCMMMSSLARRRRDQRLRAQARLLADMHTRAAFGRMHCAPIALLVVAGMCIHPRFSLSPPSCLTPPPLARLHTNSTTQQKEQQEEARSTPLLPPKPAAAMARAAKEAVVVVIDTSASMAEPYPIHDSDDSGNDDGSDGVLCVRVCALCAPIVASALPHHTHTHTHTQHMQGGGGRKGGRWRCRASWMWPRRSRCCSWPTAPSTSRCVGMWMEEGGRGKASWGMGCVWVDGWTGGLTDENARICFHKHASHHTYSCTCTV